VGRFWMADDYVECPEVAGKTIKSLRLYKNSDQGNEVIIIDLTLLDFRIFMKFRANSALKM
jgi:hypothetical protein